MLLPDGLTTDPGTLRKYSKTQRGSHFLKTTEKGLELLTNSLAPLSPRQKVQDVTEMQLQGRSSKPN